MNFMHIQKLEYMLLYKSPPGRHHHPRQIKPGIEEIEVIVSGHGDFIKENKRVRFGPGSSVWYYGGELVEVISDSKEPYETIVFCYAVSGIPTLQMPFYSEWETPVSCNSFCRKAFNSYQMGHIDIAFFSNCTYARLAWEASEFSREKLNTSRPLALEKAVSYIEKNFNKKIQVNHIAGIAGVSSSHLHMLFQKHISMSPIQYLLKLRLNKAAELLVNTQLPVKQICFETGFTDLRNFYLYFKRQHNLTPTQYRLLQHQYDIQL